MKVCIECGRQLFDYDKMCDKCNSENIISENEYNTIVKEINSANIFKRKKLMQNHNYKCIYDRMQQPIESYPAPTILMNNSNLIESSEEYWNRINQHTINKDELQKSIIECPYCHSTNTKKITNLSKAAHTAVFGIWSMGRNSKEWHCNHCNSDF